MSWASKTYTFSPSTTISSTQVNQNFDDMVSGLNTAMPSGGIIIWSGAIAAIPSGWYICDGSNSTPDLRAKFVIGANTTTYPVGATGGATAHSHTVSGTASASPNGRPNRTDGGSTQLAADHTHAVTGTAASVANNTLPPYYALAYIRKS